MTFTGFTGSNLPALRDDFNRADSADLSNGGAIPWREGSDDSADFNEVISNRAAPNYTALATAYWDGIESTHIGFAFTIAVADATAYAIAGAIVTPDAGNGVDPIEYYLVGSLGTIEMWYSNGVLMGTSTLSASFASGDQIGFDIEDTGPDIVAKFFRRAGGAGSWVQVGSITDAAAARSGPWDPGFGFFGITTARIDDFYAEAITAAAAVAAPPRRSAMRRA